MSGTYSEADSVAGNIRSIALAISSGRDDANVVGMEFLESFSTNSLR